MFQVHKSVDLEVARAVKTQIEDCSPAARFVLSEEFQGVEVRPETMRNS